MKRICRIGDPAAGTCTAHHSPVGWTGTIATGSSTVTADGLGVARVGDTGPTSCGHTFQIVAGSSVATAGGIAIAREGDAVIVIEGGSGTLTGGSDNVKDT
jgi:uncharacterized Zn-binding protein involved in type VI secretion